MYTKSFLLFATLVGIIIVNKISFVAGLLIFCSLLYSCTSCYIRGKVEEIDDSLYRRWYFQYIVKITEVSTDIIFSVDWRECMRKVISGFLFLKKLKNSIRGDNNFSLCQEAESKNYCDELPSVESEINTVINCILRDYIKPWYHEKVSKDEDFVNDVGDVLRTTFLNISCHLKEVDWKELFIQILHAYRHFIYHFKMAVYEVEKDKNILETCLNRKDDILNHVQMHHWALTDEMTEWAYLQSVSSSLIKLYGPIDTRSCHTLHTILTEIISQNVVGSLVKVLTDPDRLNMWVMKICRNKKVEKPETPQVKQIHTEVNVTEQDEEKNKILENSSSVALTNEQSVALTLSEMPSLACTSDHDHGDTFNDSVVEEKRLLKSSSFNKSSSSCNAVECSSGAILDCSNNLYFPGETQMMKRSRSEDYIRHMKEICKVIPLSTSSLKSRKTYEKGMLDLNTNYPDTVTDDYPGLFEDVKIVDTLLVQKFGHNPYTLYCIEYKGLFQDTTSNPFYPVVVRETVRIKRRFREFYALHSRLESRSFVKSLMKGIRGPSKKLPTPFANMDKRNIEERRRELEAYLQALCNNSMLTRTPELQEFLAYGSDASIAFVEKQKFSQVFSDTVKGAMDVFLDNIFRIAKPVIQSQKILTDRQSSREVPEFSDFVLEYTKRTSAKYSVIEKFCSSFNGLPDEREIICQSSDEYQTRTSVHCFDEGSDEMQHKGCKCTDTYKETFFEDESRSENKIAYAVLDIIHEFVRKPSGESSCIDGLLKFIPVSDINTFLEQKLKEMNEFRCVSWLHSLHQSLWPKQKHLPQAINDELPIFLCNYLKENIIGLKHLSDAVELILGSLQNEKLNKYLLFTIFDEFIELLYSVKCNSEGCR